MSEKKRKVHSSEFKAKVEHPFFYVKRMFGYGKVRYRGIRKNLERIHVLLGFTNLMTGDRYILV